jgi:hypothetical protein
MTPEEIFDRFNPAKRPMALEGAAALELYMAQIGRNLVLLRDAVETLKAAIAEQNALLSGQAPEAAPPPNED